jgi:hypothetical protein
LIFYICEVQAARPSQGTTLTLNEGHGVSPHGTYSQVADVIAGTATTFLASDVGYRTSPSDASVVAYPALISEAFAIDRKVNLDPTTSAIAAAWGMLSLSNATSQWDSVVSAYNNDGRPVSIYYNSKSYENAVGPQSARSTIGTYVDPTGVMQVAAAYVLRNDYSSGPGVLLNEPSATNLLTNTRTQSGLNSNGESTIS